MLAYMASRKEQAKTVPDTCLNALSDQKKIDAAKLSEIAAVMGIVIDKFVNSPADNRMKEKKAGNRIAEAGKPNKRQRSIGRVGGKLPRSSERFRAGGMGRIKYTVTDTCIRTHVLLQKVPL